MAFTELSVADLQDLAREAESAGFEGFFLPEFMNDALATCQALAQVTTRIKVGPWIANIYLRHPALCAQTAVTIADTSHGRLLLGLGMSHGPIVQGVYKSKFENPRDYFREYVTIVRDGIAGKGYSGVLQVHPPLPAKHSVPIYMAALALGMVEMAGELGDGIMLYLCPLSRLPKAYAALEKGATKAGRSFSSIDITTGLPICISNDLKAARDAARESLVFYGMLPFYNKLFRYSGFEQEAAALAKGDGSGVSERMIDELYLVGSPERCRERLAAFRAAGIQLPIILPVPVAGQSYGQAARKAIAAFA